MTQKTEETLEKIKDEYSQKHDQFKLNLENKHATKEAANSSRIILTQLAENSIRNSKNSKQEIFSNQSLTPQPTFFSRAQRQNEAAMQLRPDFNFFDEIKVKKETIANLERGFISTAHYRNSFFQQKRGANTTLDKMENITQQYQRLTR